MIVASLCSWDFRVNHPDREKFSSVGIYDHYISHWLCVSFFDEDMQPIQVSKVIRKEFSAERCSLAKETGVFIRMRNFRSAEMREDIIRRIRDLTDACVVSEISDFQDFISLPKTNFLRQSAEKYILSMKHRSNLTARRDSL